MSRLLLISVLSFAVVGLSACAVPELISGSVPPGKVYSGPILNVTAPNSEGWHLVKKDSSGMVFARSGSASGESFVALVAIFDPPQTDSPKEFETIIVKSAQGDVETNRFSVIKFTHQFTAVRGYPCVQMQDVSEDRQANTGQNKTEILVLQSEHLYCRHPVQKNIGFAITYSHRGKSLHPNFQKEAHSFIEGVLVPSKP